VTKRALDVVLASCILLVLALPLVLVSLLISINLGSPIFFRQWRTGRGGAVFEMIKFRTMLEGVDDEGRLLPDEVRLTNFGRFLRATSIDELPELWNVIRGDMSLVGPRPLLPEYVPLYSEQQARRHEVRPGLTGWAQVNGRNRLSWPEKLALDVWYVDNCNLGVDIRILIATVAKVVSRDGISATGEATMPRFNGETE